MASPEPREDLDGQPELHGRTFARERIAKPSVQLSLGPSNEALVLLEENPQPRMVLLSEEVRNHERARDATVEQTVGRQGPGVSCTLGQPRSCLGSPARRR